MTALLMDEPELLGLALCHHSERYPPRMSAPVQAHYSIYQTPKYAVIPNNGQVTVRITLDGSVGMDLVPIRTTPADTTNGKVVEWAFAVERV